MIKTADCSEQELLERAHTVAESVRRGEVELLVIAYEWAIAHGPDTRPHSPEADRPARPGRERRRPLGGPVGTAPIEVGEFAAAELGARMGRTTHHARMLMADALDLHHRLPQLWSRVQAGEVRASYARHVAAQTRDLEPAAAAHVDAQVAEPADGRIPWTRFERLVQAAVTAADPTRAEQHETKARQARFAKRIGLPQHGMASFLIRADLATIEQLDTAITEHAARAARDLPTEPDTGEDQSTVSIDDQRLAAVLTLATGATTWTDVPAPKVDLVVHLSADPRELDTDGQPLARIAKVEGRGYDCPVTEHWLRDVLGPRATFTIRPVFYPLEQAPVDAYQIPARHRRAVRILTPADVFPWGSTPHPREIDHTIPWHPPSTPSTPGRSEIGNYGPLTTTHHRIKTHGGWQVAQPFPGTYLWQDPHGHRYLVDHTGTRHLGSERRPIVAEFHAAPPIRLAGQFALAS